MNIWQRWKRTTIANKALVWTGFLVAFGTVFYAGAAACQVSIMKQSARDSSSQVERLVGTTNKAITSAVDSSGKSIQQSLQQNKDSLDSAMTQYRASLDASIRQSKESLDASVAASRNDLRAWLAMSDIHLAKEPAVGEDLVIVLDIFNSGRTPAINASLRYHSPINFTEPPANYDWTSIVPRPTNMIFPGGRLRDERLVIEGTKMTQAVVDTYRAGRTTISVQIRIEYDDVFGCRHWTQTCDTHAFGDSQFSQCENGGGIGVDIGPCQKKAQ